MEKIHSAVGSGCKADFQWVQACSRNPKKNPLHTGQLLFKACKDVESIGCRSKDVTSIVFFFFPTGSERQDCRLHDTQFTRDCGGQRGFRACSHSHSAYEIVLSRSLASQSHAHPYQQFQEASVIIENKSVPGNQKTALGVKYTQGYILKETKD